MCVWENANHPDSQATPPVIQPVIPSLTQTAKDQENMAVSKPTHPQLTQTQTQTNTNNNNPARPSNTVQNQISTSISGSKHKPTGGFRIRLHWQRGFNWQDSPLEKFYCMQTRGSASSGTKIEIDTCKNFSIRQKFLAVGRTIRPATNPSLCITVVGYGGKSSPTVLRPCSYRVAKSQSFDEITSYGKFELQPEDKSGRCLSQHHHPKPHEVVFPEKCEKTRRFDTTFWTTY